MWTWWGPAKGKCKGTKSKGKGKGKGKTHPPDKWDIMRTWPNHYLQVGGLQEPITLVASELVCDWDPPCGIGSKSTAPECGKRGKNKLCCTSGDSSWTTRTKQRIHIIAMLLVLESKCMQMHHTSAALTHPTLPMDIVHEMLYAIM